MWKTRQAAVTVTELEWQIPGLGFCQTLTLTDCRDGRGVVCEWARGGRIYNRESRISRSVKDAEHEM